MNSGFQIFNKFAVFLYSQLQNILPDQTLGSNSDWNGHVNLDSDQPGLPHKTADEFVLNVDFHNLFIANKLHRPCKFVDQSMFFCKAFCEILLSITSNLVSVLSAFDFAVMIDGPQRHYIDAVEKHTTYVVAAGFSTSD